jgi:uncharacterized membrane protein
MKNIALVLIHQIWFVLLALIVIRVWDLLPLELINDISITSAVITLATIAFYVSIGGGKVEKE